MSNIFFHCQDRKFFLLQKQQQFLTWKVIIHRCSVILNTGGKCDSYFHHTQSMYPLVWHWFFSQLYLASGIQQWTVKHNNPYIMQIISLWSWTFWIRWWGTVMGCSWSCPSWGAGLGRTVLSTLGVNGSTTNPCRVTTGAPCEGRIGNSKGMSRKSGSTISGSCEAPTSGKVWETSWTRCMFFCMVDPWDLNKHRSCVWIVQPLLCVAWVL